MRLLILPVLGLLALAGCAGSDTDARQEHLLACETYTTALEKVALWIDLGKFNDAQLATVRRIEATTTPLCMDAEPSLNGAQLVQAATTSIESLLLQIVIEES